MSPVLKRSFDLCFSLVAVAFFFVPGLAIALLITTREKHPVFFKQARIGRNKKPFEVLKFQTLVDGKPTRTGRILRATGVDEWPQFLNVMKGEMSIVGPRPLTRADIERLGWDDPYHAHRWNLKPGITGFAQLYGGQHKKTSWFWDQYYLRHQNLLFDAGVIALSFLMNVFGKKKIRRIVFGKQTLK